MDGLSIGAALGYAFLGGVILNAMPCVFPMLGIKLMSVVKKADATKATIRLSGILYTLGVVLSFLFFAGMIAALKNAGQQVGWGFQLQSPTFIAALAVLFVLMALNFFGMFEFGIPGWLIPQNLQRKNGLLGEFLAGVMVALVASPCTAPFMASALGYALAQPVGIMMLIFAFIGLGLGAPFLLLTFVPSLARFLPKPGMWMITLRQLLAFPLLLTVVWLVWVFSSQTDENRTALLLAGLVSMTFLVWLYKITEGRKYLRVAFCLLALVPLEYTMRSAVRHVDKPKSVATDSLIEKHGVKWHQFDDKIVNKLTADGKTVFVDFTANWCITCQANASAVFGSDEVVSKVNASKNVALVLADWTEEDDVISKALEAQGRSGVPLYLVYKPGVAKPEILPQILTPEIFMEATAMATTQGE
jgi:thiol:disulfide interchange protein DsbD